ncbi:hypothetical protein ACFLZJ_01555 [Nanoarchaeota archaeon]
MEKSMYYPDKMKKVRTKDKKAISVMIGYILLISFALIMSGIIYAWVVTYAPKGSLDCPDGTSVFIQKINCPADFNLNLTLKNNGRFNIGGYFIRATNESEQELATVELSGVLNGSAYSGGIILNPGVKYIGEKNPMKPGDEMANEFILVQQIYSIEIIPVRWQEYDGKERLITCTNARITEQITCG